MKKIVLVVGLLVITSREAWYPNRYGWKDGVRSGTISLAFNAAYNLFREFVWKK
ncbi:MAG: hypothetical protein ABJB34_10255 [Acidobacteriota bacterium]